MLPESHFVILISPLSPVGISCYRNEINKYQPLMKENAPLKCFPSFKSKPLFEDFGADFLTLRLSRLL